MRKYEPIWIALKKNITVSIAAPVRDHKTIIQGLRKEKWRDLAYKLQRSEAGYKLEVTEVVEEVIITFTLKEHTLITMDML